LSANLLPHGGFGCVAHLWFDGRDPYNASTRPFYTATRHEDKIGNLASHGCARMGNADVIELFDFANEGAPVIIGD
jgi:hypothetical protein